MNATATITPANRAGGPGGPQYMRALERANKVRLARAELKRMVALGEISKVPDYSTFINTSFLPK